MKILGIDPGLATVGWAVIEIGDDAKPKPIDYGAILTGKDVTIQERLSEIYDDINHIINQFDPEVCGMETLLFYNNVKSAIVVGQARGVILLSLQQSNIPVYDFTPLQVKSSITGYGKANKKQVQENVKMICGLESIPRPDDAADAIEIGRAHV